MHGIVRIILGLNAQKKVAVDAVHGIFPVASIQRVYFIEGRHLTLEWRPPYLDGPPKQSHWA